MKKDQKQVVPVDDRRDSNVAYGWVTSVGMCVDYQDEEDGVGSFKRVFGYKKDVSRFSDDAIEARIAEYAALGISVTKSEVSGQKKLCIFDPAQVAAFQRWLGSKGVELETDLERKYGEGASAQKQVDQATPDWYSFFSWDIMGVGHRDGSMGPAYRINLDRLTRDQEFELMNAMAKLGVKGNVRNATIGSESVVQGDRTFRVSDPESVRKLEGIFKDAPTAEKDWRDLGNWDTTKKAYNSLTGLEIPTISLNVNTMSAQELNHLQASLSSWGITAGVKTCSSKGSAKIKKGDRYLYVDGGKYVEKLKAMTAIWTPASSTNKMMISDRGAR